MLRHNIKIFTLLLVIIIFFIIIRNGQIFDLGRVFRLIQPNIPFNTFIAELDDLEELYKELLVENVELRDLKEENNKLRELLDFSKRKNYNIEVANILGRDEVNKNILIIDIGKDKEIIEGQAVVINNGIIVGKVIEVSLNSSKVRLLTDQESSIAVRVGEESITGILNGSLGLGMNLNYIPQEQDIKINDLVITSHLDEIIPANLIVGNIEKIGSEEEEIFKNALISSFIDYNSLYLVAVITL